MTHIYNLNHNDQFEFEGLTYTYLGMDGMYAKALHVGKLTYLSCGALVTKLLDTGKSKKEQL